MLRRSMLLPFVMLCLAVCGDALAQDSAEIRFRSGNIKVRRTSDWQFENTYDNSLTRDSVAFGFCYEDPRYRRLPTTYYHPRGPVGLAFQQYNWFPGPASTYAPNRYAADARLPASLLGQGALGEGLGMLGTVWSEPPVAVLGIEAGTPAAYARPYQPFDFFEANAEIVELNQRQGKDAFFHYINDARERGAQLRIFQGPLRQQLHDRAPHKFYKLMILESCTGEDGEKIALDLLTREGIAECFKHLADDGVLCVHTSHRFVDMPPILGAIANDLKLAAEVGHDMERDRNGRVGLEDAGHWTSEWVMLARKRELLARFCKPPPDYKENNAYWSQPRPFDQVWTDKGPNLLHGVLRGHPATMRYSAVFGPASDLLVKAAEGWGVKNFATRQFLRDLGRMPRFLEDFYVHKQLTLSPRAETLWP